MIAADADASRRHDAALTLLLMPLSFLPLSLIISILLFYHDASLRHGVVDAMPR